MPEPRALATMQYGEFSRQAYDRAVQQDRIIKAQLELTYRCNLHCRHCYTDPYNNTQFFSRELALNEIHRLLDEMRDLGIIWLNLSGGDIFMHPDFFEIYERAYRNQVLCESAYRLTRYAAKMGAVRCTKEFVQRCAKIRVPGPPACPGGAPIPLAAFRRGRFAPPG